MLQRPHLADPSRWQGRVLVELNPGIVLRRLEYERLRAVCRSAVDDNDL
jgi:hypothetical protein